MNPVSTSERWRPTWRIALAAMGLALDLALVLAGYPWFDRPEASTFIAIPVIALFFWMPAGVWVLLARTREWGPATGVTLVMMGAGAIIAAWWPPVDWTIPLGLHIALAYPLLAAVVVAAAARMDARRGGRRPGALRQVAAYLLLAAQLAPAGLFGVLAGLAHGDLRNPVPEGQAPARSELLPLPVGLVVVSEERGGGSQSDGITFEVEATDGASTPEVLDRLRDHLRRTKSWRLHPPLNPATDLGDDCRPLTLYLVRLGDICVWGMVDRDSGRVHVNFNASIL
jgi:hypothetical protein